jgi:hypothetical protein
MLFLFLTKLHVNWEIPIGEIMNYYFISVKEFYFNLGHDNATVKSELK